MNSSSYLWRLLGSCRKNLLCNVQRLCSGRHQMFLGNWPRQRVHRQSPVPRYCSTSKAIDLVAYNRYTKRNLVDGHVKYWKMQKKKAHVLDWKIDFLINFFPLVHITVEEALELNRQNFRQLPKGQLLGCLLELLTPLMQKIVDVTLLKNLYLRPYFEQYQISFPLKTFLCCFLFPLKAAWIVESSGVRKDRNKIRIAAGARRGTEIHQTWLKPF